MTLREQTIARNTEFSGIGIHSGRTATVRVKPWPALGGIVFQRTDIPGAPPIPALIENVTDTRRGTTIGSPPNMVRTVEHLLAACHGLGIDNLLVEIDGEEMPIMDGSSLPFIGLLKSASLARQDAPRKTFSLDRVITAGAGESVMVGIPESEFIVTMAVHYPHRLVGSQYFHGPMNAETFEGRIAMARTFGFGEEIEYLRKNNLALGGSIDNALIFLDDAPSTPLRIPDEPVRHKVLDLLGDFCLLGARFAGRIIAIKPSHRLHIEFLGKMKSLCAQPLMPHSEIPPTKNT